MPRRKFPARRSLVKLAFILQSGADRARTGNPHVANVVLSQLSYGPFECWNISDRLAPEQHMSLLKEHERPRQLRGRSVCIHDPDSSGNGGWLNARAARAIRV